MHAILLSLWDERNGRVSRGVDRYPSEIWSLVCLHVLVFDFKRFCNPYGLFCIAVVPFWPGLAFHL